MMTLHAAILTGKRFKRENDPCWYKLMGGTQCYLFSRADILARDWEVEEKKVTLTRDSFLKAYSKVMMNSKYFYEPTQERLLRELGLND